MKILVVDDDKEIVELLSIYLKNEGYEPIAAYSGKEAITKLTTTPDIALMILDIMMPNMSGIEVIKEVRKDSDIPIIIVSAKTGDMDKIQGLITGADDYVSKPFNPLEVMARVRSLLRRSQKQVKDDEPDILEVGPLVINRDSHEVKTIDGKAIQLTALEFGILYLLASHPNRVFSADEIFERVWKQESIISAKTVMVHVSHLRDKIQKATGGEDVIQTVWGVGYKVEAQLMKKERVKLTGAEKSELFAEGIVTIVLLLLLNLSIIILIHLAILQDESLVNGIYFLKKTMTFAGGYHLWSWQNTFIILMGVGDIVVLYWRLIRRYHQMQLRHVILELHYIASGHFDHRINFRVRPDLQRVVDSINSLVDSTVHSINEERAIEQSKDELITNVSHDIRTPLTSIIGYLGLLKSGVASPEDQQKYVDIAYTKAEQMKSLANDLFEYTTLKSTKLNLTSLHIYSMLEQVAAGFELEAEKKGIEIKIEARPKDLTIRADAEKLVRVYNNLISNALKYGIGATQIKLVANLVNKREVELRVENNGEPIPKKSLKKIFDRFYRVETSRNTKTGGTGLGLSITEGVVDLHHGTIRCESDKNWTSFIIRLPLNPKKTNSKGQLCYNFD